VGEGPDRAALARQIKEAGLGDRIELLGARTSLELVELLRAADLVAAPSVPSRDGRREGIPVALMEAMAMGLPVVASRLSGIPELVEHDKSGLLVEPGDVGGLADAIELLCSEPALRRRLGGEAREKVLSEFDLNTNAAALAELFASRSLS
jgi:glycosyltransferase involved in cell wall biosynthesis